MSKAWNVPSRLQTSDTHKLRVSAVGICFLLMTCILLAGTLNNKFAHLVVLLSDIQKFRRASCTKISYISTASQTSSASSTTFLVFNLTTEYYELVCVRIYGRVNENAFWKSFFSGLKLFLYFERVDGV